MVHSDHKGYFKLYGLPFLLQPIFYRVKIQLEKAKLPGALWDDLPNHSRSPGGSIVNQTFIRRK